MTDDRQLQIGESSGREQGEALRDEAMHRVDTHADPDWKTACERAVWRIIKRGEAFTSDDVWTELEGVDWPREPRALGPIVAQKARAGFIAATGQYRKSDRPECHRNPKAVWHPTLAGRSEAARQLGAAPERYGDWVQPTINSIYPPTQRSENPA